MYAFMAVSGETVTAWKPHGVMVLGIRSASLDTVSDKKEALSWEKVSGYLCTSVHVVSLVHFKDNFPECLL